MPLIGMAGSTVMMRPGLDALRLASELGFAAFELFGEFPQCICGEMTAAERREGRAVVEQSGLALAVHAPFTSLNLAALNPGIRAESARQTIEAIDLCADLGGKVVITHNGEYVVSERAREKAPEAARIQWENNLASLRACLARARERGITLCLENIGFELGHMDRNVDDLLRMAEEAGPELAFCLDIGHARLNHELPQAIAKMGPRVRHIHFTDNFGERDDHVVIGEGNFDYTPHLEFFRAFNGIITLEVINIGDDPTPAIKSREYVKKTLKIG